MHAVTRNAGASGGIVVRAPVAIDVAVADLCVLRALTERRHLAFRQLKSLLAAVASVSSLIIFIDDLQWADEDSLALLRDLVRPPDAPACLLVATMRPLDDEATAPLRELLTCFRTLELTGLSPNESETLLTRLFSGGAIRPEAWVRRRELAGEAGGHPMWLAELARHDDAATGR